MNSARRTQRLADFRSRAEYAPESVYRHQQFGWEYIPVHPFSDEKDTLERLGLDPEECLSVDAWWSTGDDATLLQATAGKLQLMSPGLYARETVHPKEWTYLMVCTGQPMVSRSTFELAMSRFVELGFPSEARFQLPAGAGYTKVDTWPPTASDQVPIRG